MTIYLVDFENVYDNGLKSITSVMPVDKILVFYSESTPRIGIDTISEIMNQLRFIKITNGSKNALDYQLSTYLGYLIGEYGPDNKFVIVSKDTGYKKVVDFWENNNVHSISIQNDVKGIVPDTDTKANTKTKQTKKIQESNDKKKKDLEAKLKKITKNEKDSKSIAEICVSAKSKGEVKTFLTKKYGTGNPKFNGVNGFLMQYLNEMGVPDGILKTPCEKVRIDRKYMVSKLTQITCDTAEAESIADYCMKAESRSDIKNYLACMYGTKDERKKFNKINEFLNRYLKGKIGV